MPGVGVDIVDLARIAASIERGPGRLAGRICSAAEQAWIGEGDAVERLAACFALKEAWIKAMAGRPEGFGWSAHAYDPAAAAIAGVPAIWARVDDAVIALVGRARVATGASAPIGGSAAGLTKGELAYCGGSPQRIAGRVAAKAAVAALAGTGREIEILPGEHPSNEPLPCRGSHPPRVSVGGGPSEVAVTITHGNDIATAVAWIA